MKKYSIGYNHDKAFLKIIPAFKDYISEVYFPTPYYLMGSGRATKHEKDYDNTIKEIIKSCKKNRIKSNLLLNAACEGKNAGEKEHSDKIILYLKKLKKVGLHSVTVANPIHLQRIKKEIPQLETHASVNCYVKNLEHAKYLKTLGADVITIDRDINRNIGLIKDIKRKTGAKIKILLNEGCLKNCPFRAAHFAMISHKKDTDYFDSMACINIYKKNPEKVFSIPFVRPEDIRHYGFADYFKLATRTTPTIKIPIILEAYKKQAFSGDLLQLLSTKGLFGCFESINNDVLTKNSFFENMARCDEDCKSCSFCKKMLKKAAVIRR